MKLIKNRLKNNCRKINIENQILLLLTSLLLFYFIEAAYFQSFSSGLSFLFANHKPGICFVNFCIIFFFELLLFSIVDSIPLSFGITSSAALSLVIVNNLKMQARGEAFTFNDIFVAKEALMVAGSYNLQFGQTDLKIIVLICLLMTILFLEQKKCSPNRMRKKIRKKIIYNLLLTGLFFAFWMNMEQIILFFGGESYVYITSAYYTENGYMAGIARTTPHKIKKPSFYSRKSLTFLKETVVPNTANNKTPNLIIVMNESLYDISNIGKVTFSKDPLEKLKTWQTTCTHGNFISPTSGGGTCNVEFEVLTGCPLDCIGEGTLPYSDMIRRNIASLVSSLNVNGYCTTAFHPNTGTFFNRRNVYKHMGFHKIYFSEELGELPTEGLYPSDYELYKKVIDSFQENQKTEMPFFSYVTTMQNHGGYNYEYNSCNIEVLDSGNFGNKQALETYANLLSSSIDAFEYLISYFENIAEPTVIVMFGDHSPGILEFGDTDFNYDGIELLKTRTTPLIVYSNYNLPYEDWGYINGYSLASKILDYCEIKMDEYFYYETDVNNIPILGEKYYLDNKWTKPQDAESKIIKYRESLWIMAYDRLFGKNYGDWDK